MLNRLNMNRSGASLAALISLLNLPVAHAQGADPARQAANQAQAALLAPDVFQRAERSFADAAEYATNEPERAAQAELESISLYQDAATIAQERTKFLAAPLKARDLALAAGGNRRDDRTWEKAEDALADAVSNLTRDRRDKAQEDALAATAGYDMAELLALQDSVLALVREQLVAADKLRAQRYAPTTLQRGRDFAAQTKAALQEDRTNLERAEILAQQAEVNATRALQITQYLKEKPAAENIILSWESRLQQAQRATGKTAPTSLDPAVQTESLSNEIDRLRRQEADLSNQLRDSQQFNAALEDEIRELDLQLGGASAERKSLIMGLESHARAREQLNQAKALFTDQEALVFTQSDQLVVRLIGLRFASGDSKLNENSKPLLQKLEKLIGIYPESTLLVEGHTDAQGRAEGNQRLSQARADTVRNYMVSQMHIAGQRIGSIGYGASKPIANNEFDSGREKNRRIDLIITPQPVATAF